MEELRRRVLDFFGADPAIYDVSRGWTTAWTWDFRRLCCAPLVHAAHATGRCRCSGGSGSRLALAAMFERPARCAPHYVQIVWTRSGTGALHVLGETFPFTAASRFAYLYSNHNSVLVRRGRRRLLGSVGMRAAAQQPGAHACHLLPPCKQAPGVCCLCTERSTPMLTECALPPPPNRASESLQSLLGQSMER